MKPLVGGIATVIAMIAIVNLFGRFAKSYEDSMAPPEPTEAEDPREACFDRVERDRARLRDIIDDLRNQIDDVESDRLRKDNGEKLTPEHRDFLLEGHERQLAILERQHEELAMVTCESAGAKDPLEAGGKLLPASTR